jgi:hypothetical protein
LPSLTRRFFQKDDKLHNQYIPTELLCKDCNCSFFLKQGSTAKNSQVNIVFSDDGGANFSKPIRLDEKNATGRVDVEMLDEKSAMVSWMEGAIIKAARVYKDGMKESSITIAATSESRSSGFPQMTKSGNDLIFAWSDDKNKTIKVARLSSD